MNTRTSPYQAVERLVEMSRGWTSADIFNFCDALKHHALHIVQPLIDEAVSSAVDEAADEADDYDDGYRDGRAEGDELQAQRNAAVEALIAIKQDLQASGECFNTDEARINRIDEGIRDAGECPEDSDIS